MPSISEVIEIIIKTRDQASRELKNVGQSLGGVESALGQIRNVLALGGLTYLGRQALDAAWQMGVLGAQLKTSEQRLERFANVPAAQAMNQLRAETQGLATDMDIASNASRLMQMGLAKTVEEAGTLMRIATQLGRGPDATYQLQFALSNQSLRRLDEFGYNIDRVKTRWSELKDEMGDAEAYKMAFLEEGRRQLERVGNQAETDEGKIQRLNVAWQNLRAEMGKDIETSPVVSFLLNTTNHLLIAKRASREFDDALKAALGDQDPITRSDTRTRADILYGQLQLGIISLDDYREGMNRLIGRQEDWQEELRHGSSAREEHLKYLENVGYFSYSAADATETLTERMWEAREAAEALSGARAAVIGQMRISGIGQFDLDAGAAREGSRLGGMTLEEERAYWQKKLDVGTFRSNREREDTEAKILDIDRKIAEVRQKANERESRESQALYKQKQRELEQLAQERRNFVDSLLQPTQVTELDMARTRLGAYSDKWDEYMRRVRSAATDAKSAWKHLIPTDVLAQGTDAIKVWAAETEAAFYAGQLPEQVNWDAFRQSAEEELARQKSREALISRGVQELGGQMSEEQVAQLMGFPADLTTTGEGRMNQMLEGARAIDFGAQMTQTIEAQFNNSDDTWRLIGKARMEVFLEGADGAITPKTGSEFARKIWPYFAPFVSSEINNGRRP